MIRTFIAVDLPDSFIPEIKKIGQMLRIPGIKVVDPGLVHITMKFLGDIHENKVAPIAEAMSGINCIPFEAIMKGVGVFPKPDYIRVVWLGAEGNFDQLHQEVERVLLPFNFKKDKDFTPHATLARVKQLREKEMLIDMLKKMKNIDLGTMNVSSIRLKKSTLTPDGLIYETLREITLR